MFLDLIKGRDGGHEGGFYYCKGLWSKKTKFVECHSTQRKVWLLDITSRSPLIRRRLELHYSLDLWRLVRSSLFSSIPFVYLSVSVWGITFFFFFFLRGVSVRYDIPL